MIHALVLPAIKVSGVQMLSSNYGVLTLDMIIPIKIVTATEVE